MNGEPAAVTTSRVKRIGFLSTRIAGTDGVSLETEKWRTVLEKLGYECFYVAGELDRRDARTAIIPTASFNHPEIVDIQRQSFGNACRTRELTRTIRSVSDRINEALHRCQEKFGIDLWVAENVLAIPMNIPLGLAFTEFLAETCLPCLAHHHDFLWERERFATSGVSDFLQTAFPSRLPTIRHVVLNSMAQTQLGYRLGVSSTLLPNVMDFEHPPEPPDEFGRGFRADIGLTDDDWLILQPTRIVPRKKIEHTIELLKRLNEPRARLVITHSAKDEGSEYVNHIRKYAALLQIPLLLVDDWVGQQRTMYASRVGHKRYTLHDTYPHANLVTYPSEYEGFGNAFLEAVYHRKPIICNRYSIYRTDIEPKGFQVISMDGYVSEETVAATRAVLTDAKQRAAMVEKNYELGRQYFSYAVLERRLQSLLTEVAGLAR